MVEIVPLGQVADAEIEALLDRAFEPGRRARVSYRIRAGMTPIAALCFGATEAGRLVGSIQAWPASLVEDDGRAWPLVMVGPVAVEPLFQGVGIGQRLVTRMLTAAAETAMDGAMALIGDPGYYGRFFGFTADRTGGWTAPGPVEPRRLLARGTTVPAVAGMLGPRVPAVAEPAR